MFSILILFLTSFAFFLHGVSPTLYGGDSGEFIASVHTLGIPHAPGYPLYILIIKTISTLIPFGNASYQINLTSALLASASLSFLYVILIQQLKLSKISAILTVLILAFSPIFVDQAHNAEVFILNAFLMLGIVACLLHGTSNAKLLAAFLLGLGLGNHHTLLIMFPAIFLAYWTSSQRWKMLGLGALMGLLGLSVNFYLMIRAHHNPPVNFGDPESWSRFWAVLARKEFGSLSLHPAALSFWNRFIVMEHIENFVQRFYHQVGFIGTACFAMGTVTGLIDQKTRKIVLLLFLGVMITGPLFEIYSNLSPGSAISQWRLERFILLPIVMAVLLVGITLPRNLKLVSLLLILFVGQAIAYPNVPHHRDNFIYRDFALSAFRNTPDQSVFIIDRVLFDEPTSSILVENVVGEKRRDIQFLYRPGTLFSDVFGEDILELDWGDRFYRTQEIEKKVLERHKGPVRLLAFEKKDIPFDNPIQDHLLIRPSNEVELNAVEFNLNRTRHQDTPSDYPRRLMQTHFDYLMGKALLEKQGIQAAAPFFRKAAHVGSDMAWLNSNVGSLYSHLDDTESATHYFQNAYAQDIYFYQALYGMGYIGIKNRAWNEAARFFNEAIRIQPEQANAYYMLGISYMMAGQKQAAQEAWATYAQLDPAGPYIKQVRAYLKQ